MVVNVNVHTAGQVLGVEVRIVPVVVTMTVVVIVMMTVVVIVMMIVVVIVMMIVVVIVIVMMMVIGEIRAFVSLFAATVLAHQRTSIERRQNSLPVMISTPRSPQCRQRIIGNSGSDSLEHAPQRTLTGMASICSCAPSAGDPWAAIGKQNSKGSISTPLYAPIDTCTASTSLAFSRRATLAHLFDQSHGKT